MQALLHKIIGRLMKLLTRRGVLIEEEGATYLADSDADSENARAQAAAGDRVALQAAPGQWPDPLPGTHSPLDCVCPGSAYRIAFGPRAGLQGLHGAGHGAARRRVLVPAGPAEEAGVSEPAATEPGCAHRRPARMSWARLLKRVFEIDMEHCPNCGGELKIIAAILESAVIERILTHLGLQARAPPRAPARGHMQHAA